MPKRKAKAKRQTLSMTVFAGSVEMNGRKATGINYSRVEFDDGSVMESGLPKGMQPRPSLGDLLAGIVSSTR